MSTVNWAQLAKEAGDFSPVPIGKYDAICVKAELKQAQSGNEYWATQWKIQNGPHAGRVLFNNFVLVETNPNALRMFFVNLRKLGITTEHLNNLGHDKNALTPMFVTRQALLTVEHKPYNGEMREQVAGFDPHPNGPIGSMSNIGGPAPAASAVPANLVPNPAPQAAPIPQAVPQAPAPAPATPVPAPAPVAQSAPVPPAPQAPQAPQPQYTPEPAPNPQQFVQAAPEPAQATPQAGPDPWARAVPQAPAPAPQPAQQPQYEAPQQVQAPAPAPAPVAAPQGSIPAPPPIPF